MDTQGMTMPDRAGVAKSVLSVYRMVLGQASDWRKASDDKKRDKHNREICKALATELYTVAAHLEDTQQVNPKTEFVITDKFGNEYCAKCFRNGIHSMNPEAEHDNHGN